MRLLITFIFLLVTMYASSQEGDDSFIPNQLGVIVSKETPYFLSVHDTIDVSSQIVSNLEIDSIFISQKLCSIEKYYPILEKKYPDLARYFILKFDTVLDLESLESKNEGGKII